MKKLVSDNMKNLKKIKGAFLAYNTNIDNIIHVDKRIERFINEADFHKRNKIKSEKELFSAISYYIKKGEAMEIPIESEVSNWLSENIKPDRQRMGGQAGIMGNIISSFGIRTIVYTPFLSKKQANLFGKNVSWWKNFKHPRKTPSNHKEKVNWIFEYQNGTRLFNKRIKYNGRFIAASRPEGYEFKLNSARKIIPKIDFVIISGFQNVNNKYRKQFSSTRKILREFNNAEIPVHLELVATNSRNLRYIRRLIKYTDSVGLDNTELQQLLSLMRKKDGNEIEEKLRGIEKILNLGTKAVHLHYKGYFLTVMRKDYFANPDEVKKSMEFAAVVTAAEAVSDVKKPSDAYIGLKIPVSSEGRKKIKKLEIYLRKRGIEMKNQIAETGGSYIVAVPNRMVKKPKDIVGLGDIVSASIFSAENAWKLCR